MTVVEVVARAKADAVREIEQLVCHPRLPLFAVVDAERPAIHVWSHEAGRLNELAAVGTTSEPYGDSFGWARMKRAPALAWHPHQQLLVASTELGGSVKWTQAGFSELEGVPAGARYRYLAFSSDGRALWGSPSSAGGKDAWQSSDVIDLDSGTVGTGPQWDTGVAAHPGGGLVLTLASDQGATLGLFAHVDDESAPGAMRILRRALILDADSYSTPIFSADGRHFAVRGNAYGHILEVFEFPSLRRVLATSLDEPGRRNRDDIGFGARPGLLWIGRPSGTLVELDLQAQSAIEHDVLPGTPFSVLSATAAGDLLIASDDGELMLVSVIADTAPETVAAFLDSTSEVPDNSNPEPHLILTNGTRTWDAEGLETVTAAEATDPVVVAAPGRRQQSTRHRRLSVPAAPRH